MRPALCEDALRFGRILAELAPREPEVHGLVALMEIQASRSSARVTSTGEPILLLEQNRARWDQLLIGRGLAALHRSEQVRGPDAASPGPYALQAAIAACHARARAAEETDWTQIAALYAQLARLTPSPVVELNRAVALAMAFGPAAGLEIVDSLVSERSLENYHLLPASAATFSRNSAASTKPAPNSSVPPLNPQRPRTRPLNRKGQRLRHRRLGSPVPVPLWAVYKSSARSRDAAIFDLSVTPGTSLSRSFRQE